MKALSASTTTPDPYRAGVLLGEALLPLSPEVVFLFGTIQYGDSSELLDGLYDTLGSDDLLVIGNSGDGFHETERVADYGVAALGLNSGGRVRWSVSHAPNVGTDPAGAARLALDSLQASLGEESPAFIFLVSDFRTDSTVIEDVIQRETNVPVIGGLAGDDYRFLDCVLYANRKVLRDGLVLLGAAGDIAFDISIGNAITPIGQPGRIDAVDGTQITQIDGLGAMDFVQRETGKRALQTERGVMSLAFFDPEHPEQKRLRSVVPTLSHDEASLPLFGRIAPGTMVQVGIANAVEVLDEITALADRSRALPFVPSAAVVVSCAGRKQLLGDRIAAEVQAFTAAHPGGMAVAGFPSFGEIAPLKDGNGRARNLFHNMTYVVLLLGSPP